MSMEHKAYLFDSKKYKLLVKNVLKQCCRENGTAYAEKYIKDNFDKLKSPYTGEQLTKEELEGLADADIQEYMDYILTECYEPNCDIGLGYTWDSIIAVLKQMPLNYQAEFCMLGEEIEFYGVVVDPGRMGMGIIEAEEVISIYNDLKKNDLSAYKITQVEDTLYEFDEEELSKAYKDLLDIYKQAGKEGKGLLMTF